MAYIQQNDAVTLIVQPGAFDETGQYLSVTDFVVAFSHLAEKYPDHGFVGWGFENESFRFHFANAEEEYEPVRSAHEIAARDQIAAYANEQQSKDILRLLGLEQDASDGE